MQDPALKTPEAGSRAAAYGSAAHTAIAALEDGLDDAQAVQAAWNEWGHWLDPDDLALLHQDVETFHRRDWPNTRAVLVEDEVRVPLILADGELAYFRARIDRLYERVDRPGSFILVDYKTSRWPKSESEIRGEPEAGPAALQLRSYDWCVHEHLPEIEELLCVYDQLRYGSIAVRHSDQQRARMRDWLVAQMSAYFADQDYQQDGLLAPRFNEWCPWCPILESCPIVEHLSEFALSRIATIRGEELAGAEDLARFAELYSTAKGAAKVIERFVESINALARELGGPERERLGFRVAERRQSKLGPSALAQLQERLGEQFLEIVSVTKKRLESLDDPDLRDWALSLMEPSAPSQIVSRKETLRR